LGEPSRQPPSSFSKKFEHSTQEAIFIDHGHMFCGPEWNFEGDFTSPLHLGLAVYTDLWQDDQIARWISRFQSLIPKVMKSEPQSMLGEWYA
jgi:hypothetical protein